MCAGTYGSCFKAPPGALRGVWKVQPHGTPKKCRHPLAKGLPSVVNRVTITAHADNLRLVHPTENADDPVRGLAVHVTGLGLKTTMTPAPPVPPPPRRPPGSLRRNARPPPARVPGTLEVELEEVRVLLPPEDAAWSEAGFGSGGGSGGAGDVYGQTVRDRAGGGAAGSRGGSPRNGSPRGGSPKTPSSKSFPSFRTQSSLWGGIGSGDFDREAERYRAVIEMLEGSGSLKLGGGGGGGGGDGGGGGGEGKYPYTDGFNTSGGGGVVGWCTLNSLEPVMSLKGVTVSNG